MWAPYGLRLGLLPNEHQFSESQAVLTDHFQWRHWPIAIGEWRAIFAIQIALSYLQARFRRFVPRTDCTDREPPHFPKASTGRVISLFTQAFPTFANGGIERLRSGLSGHEPMCRNAVLSPCSRDGAFRLIHGFKAEDGACVTTHNAADHRPIFDALRQISGLHPVATQVGEPLFDAFMSDRFSVHHWRWRTRLSWC